MKKVMYGLSMMLVSFVIIVVVIFIQDRSASTYTYAAHQYADAGINRYIKSEILKNDRLIVEPINIIFAGDTLFDWSVKTTIDNYGPDYPFVYVKEEVEQADLSILNLETAVTIEEEKDPIQLYNFKSDPIALAGVKNAGFDMVSLANNHAMDYQIDGFLDTLENLNNYELKYFGAGKNYDEAYRAQEVEIKGKSIKILGFSRFMPAVRWYEGEGPVIASGYQVERVLETIEREKRGTDYLLVYIHWGVEKNNKPEEWQRQYARQMLDAGADGIIGSHPHVLQGFEFYGNKPIAYSLGNFLFPDYVSGKTAETGLLKLSIIDEQISMKFSPYYIKADQIHPLEEHENQKLLEYLKEISFNVDINTDGVIRDKNSY